MGFRTEDNFYIDNQKSYYLDKLDIYNTVDIDLQCRIWNGNSPSGYYFFNRFNAIAYIEGKWDFQNHCIIKEEEIAIKSPSKQTDLFDSYTIEQIEEAAIKIVGEDEVRDIIEELKKFDKNYKPKDAKKHSYNTSVEYIKGIPKYVKCISIYNRGTSHPSIMDKIYCVEINPDFSSSSWEYLINIRSCFIASTEYEFIMQEISKTKENV